MKISPYVYRDLSPMPQSEFAELTVGGPRRIYGNLAISLGKTAADEILDKFEGILAEIETLTSNSD